MTYEQLAKKRLGYRNAWRREKYTITRQINTLLKAAQRRAAKENLECTLTRDWLRERLEAGKCEATGLLLARKDVKLAEGKKFMNPRGASIDRIDSALGYTPENCQLVCLQYNVAKGEWGEAELRELIEALITKNP